MGVVILVRHGQASFGAEDYDVLSETGWQQSRGLGAYLAGRGIVPGLVLRGDMRRHRETAEGLLDGAGWDVPVEVDRGWNEFDHLGVVAAYPDLPNAVPPGTPPGDRRAFQRLFELATERWTSGEHDGDYAESFPAFRGRVGDALARACARAGSGATVLVVSSGGPVATACGLLVAPPEAEPAVAWQLWRRFNAVVVNSSFSRVIVGESGSRLLTFNEHPHLEGDALTYR